MYFFVAEWLSFSGRKEFNRYTYEFISFLMSNCSYNVVFILKGKNKALKVFHNFSPPLLCKLSVYC